MDVFAAKICSYMFTNETSALTNTSSFYRSQAGGFCCFF